MISAWLYRSVTLARRLQRRPDQRALDRLDRHADRRRAGVQLRDHVENIPATVSGHADGFELVAARCSCFWSTCSCWCWAACSRARTILLVIVPILIPTAQALGIDMVHFGVVVVFNVMIGLVTPPYGVLLFVISNITGIPLRPIIRDTLPFVLAMVVALIIITFVPETVLWLPRQLGYKG